MFVVTVFDALSRSRFFGGRFGNIVRNTERKAIDNTAGTSTLSSRGTRFAGHSLSERETGCDHPDPKGVELDLGRLAYVVAHQRE